MPRVVPEYKEEAKNRIVSAANQVFAEKGYRQATMDDVAKKIGVSKGALYLYFASKEELFEAICRTEPLALRDILYSTFSESKSPLRSEEHTSELQSRLHLVCRLLLEKKKTCVMSATSGPLDLLGYAPHPSP